MLTLTQTLIHLVITFLQVGVLILTVIISY